MKKILFIIPNLSHGGAEKVLVNLVNNMDKRKFNITVQTLFDEGVNKQFINHVIKNSLEAIVSIYVCFLLKDYLKNL